MGLTQKKHVSHSACQEFQAWADPVLQHFDKRKAIA